MGIVSLEPMTSPAPTSQLLDSAQEPSSHKTQNAEARNANRWSTESRSAEPRDAEAER